MGAMRQDATMTGPKTARITRRGLLALPLAAGLAEAATAQVRETQLIMFVQPGCYWCRQWDRDVSRAYSASPEGRRAPLRRVDITAAVEPDLRNLTGTRFTPTFVLWHRGGEIGRIMGYQGADFFWPQVTRLIAQLPGGDTRGDGQG